MKYVSFLFALALIGFAGIANAEHTTTMSFYYNDHDTYYACSYAEGRASTILEVVGAENVTTNCSGGIDQTQPWMPVSLTASFTHHEKGARTVVIKGNEACDFNVKLVKTVLSTIDHEVLKAKHSCWGSSGRYYFEVALK